MRTSKRLLALLTLGSVLCTHLPFPAAWAEETVVSSQPAAETPPSSVETPATREPTSDAPESSAAATDPEPALIPDSADETSSNATTEKEEGNPLATATTPPDIFSPDSAAKPDPLQNAKLGGKVEVGEFTGAALYSYPVSMPPGRSGLSPAVALSYNSQDNELENLVGFHWSLTLHSIRRLNKAGVDQMHSRNDFTASTPFGGGELQEAGGGLYLEKIQGSFAKYEHLPDGSWLVTDKQGIRYFYGTSGAGRQFDPAEPSRVFQWMLEEVRDRDDHWIRYTYFKDGNQIYPKAIRYTGHGNENGIFEVRFMPFYNGNAGPLRPDKHSSYAAGFLVETKALLSGIEVWADGHRRRKVELDYIALEPFVRKTLQNILETSYDPDGNATSLPPSIFQYSPSSVSWQETSEYAFPGFLEDCFYACQGAKWIREWDMNGDGLTDFEYYEDQPPYVPRRALNNGAGGWNITNSQFLGANRVYEQGLPDLWRKPVDFDGDGLNDLLQSGYYYSSGPQELHSSLRLNRGGNYQDTVAVAMGNNMAGWPDNGASVGDLNGDGLPDLIQSRGDGRGRVANTCLNTGNASCAPTSLWLAPNKIVEDGYQTQYRRGTAPDCNQDGLADLFVYSYLYDPGGSWANDGKGGWVPGAYCTSAQVQLETPTRRSFDANGDGLMDRVVSEMRVGASGNIILVNELYINTGNGEQRYDNVFPLPLGGEGVGTSPDNGIRIVDLNGDGLPDVLQSLKTQDPYNHNQIAILRHAFLNRGLKPYLLKTIHTSSGAWITLDYKNSAELRKPDGSLANPALPLNVTTLTRMTVDDGLGNLSFTDYLYEDGHYYFNDARHREWAGFRAVTKTDSLGFKTKTFFHQDEYSLDDTARGEWQDHISKKGLPYRIELYDNEGHLLRSTINRYEKMGVGSGFFPYLEKTVTVDYDPATGQKKAKAQEFEFNWVGNRIAMTDYGEVHLVSDDGSFTDVGGDRLRRETAYAQTPTGWDADWLIGLPAETKLFDQEGHLRSHQRTYYDGLPLARAAKGHSTRQETWLDSTNIFLATETAYDPSYGLPIRQTNARGFSTDISYDGFHLYPATVTNALGQATHFVYDPGLGKPLETLDPNGLKTKTAYDGQGRPLTVEISDPARPTRLIVAKTLEYNDSVPFALHEKAYDGTGESVESYMFADALGRTVETKQEAKGGQWVTAQTIFDARGNVAKNVQPFFSASPAFETPDPSKTGTALAYDGLSRLRSATTPLGTTTTTYSLWNRAVTDADGKTKGYAFDARGVLTQVTEHEGREAPVTTYAYDPLGRLTWMTDARGNTREFTHDSLGRRLTQTDAHRPGGRFGIWTYDYDENGNVVSRTDPRNQKVGMAYDALDRLTTQQADQTLIYTYDQGANSIGRLSEVAGEGYQRHWGYDLLGRVIQDHRAVGGRELSFGYAYDLLGGVTAMAYPDGMTVDYTYDSAHQMSSVSNQGKLLAEKFSYSPLGQVTQFSLGNHLETTSLYDPAQLYRLTQKKTLLWGITRLQDLEYQYDPVGNLMKLVDQSHASTAKTVDYQYDDLHRILEARYHVSGQGQPLVQTFAYDALGNLTSKSDVGTLEYGWRNPHAVTQAGPHRFEYDDSGNQTKRDDVVLRYDALGRLIQSGQTAYAYDEAGQRIEKKDLATGKTKLYLSPYYEADETREDQFVFAGPLKVAKLSRILSTIPGPDPTPAPGPQPTPSPTPAPIPDPGNASNGSQPLPKIDTGGGGGKPSHPPSRQPGKARPLPAKPIVPSLSKAEPWGPYSGTRQNTPKPLWPTVNEPESDFKNLSIAFTARKAVLRWDAMGPAITRFEIYRSSKPFPAPASRNTGLNIGSVEAETPVNRFEDASIGTGERYTYRVVALNRDGKIAQTSILLTPELIFVDEGQETVVNFGPMTEEPFTQLRISDNSEIDFKPTADPKAFVLTLRSGFKAGHLEARFLRCAPPPKGPSHCETVETKTFPVYALEVPGFLSRLQGFMGDLAALVLPSTQAQGPIENRTLYYYLTDHLGGVEAVVDEEGNVVERADYLPFGQDRARTGSSGEHYGFTGKELDPESGLHYYGARYYDSLTGRFLSEDPLGLGEAGKALESILANPQELNGYGYALNNPLRYTDPTGMLTKDGKIEEGDTLTSVTKTLNETYNINLTIDAVAEANGILDKNHIREGDYIALPKDNLILTFDNNFLQAEDTVYNVKYDDLKWAGVSGNKDNPPISEGVWTADPSDTQTWEDVSIARQAASITSSLTQNIPGVGWKMGPWPGGPSAWGTARTELSNKDTGEQRTGYYIHGGAAPGSAGCIDLTNANNSFHKWFTETWNRPIDVVVNY